mgnify:CR=1 FL=1|jgi:hypothetical protein
MFNYVSLCWNVTQFGILGLRALVYHTHRHVRLGTERERVNNNT